MERSGWIYSEALEAVGEKRKKWLKYKYCKSGDYYSNYKVERDKARYQLRRSNYAFEKKIVTKAAKDSKEFWKHVRTNIKHLSQLIN